MILLRPVRLPFTLVADVLLPCALSRGGAQLSRRIRVLHPAVEVRPGLQRVLGLAATPRSEGVRVLLRKPMRSRVS